MRLAEITRRYLNAPYKLGGLTPEEGLDCFSLIYNYGKDRGMSLPREFEGLSLSKYAAIWQSDPEKAKRKLAKFLASTCIEIEKHKTVAGDILVYFGKGRQLMLAINAGNGNMLTVVEGEGVRLLRIVDFKIEKVLRWALQQQR